MKNYVCIVLSLLVGCIIASLGCTPTQQQPAYRLLVVNHQGEIIRTYEATLIWTISSTSVTFTDAKTGKTSYVVNCSVLVESLPQHDFRSWPVEGEKVTKNK